MKKIIDYKIWLAMLMAFGFIFVLGCKKSKKATTPEEEVIAKVYDRGTVDGTATQQMIGSAGGTITTSDSRISITIPAGSVNGDVMFSIQPITSTLPLSAGKTYRLLPENVTFAKPVIITFKYDDDTFKGSSPSTANLAYQNSDGYWRIMYNTILNETNKTLSVQSTHFSDWGVIEQVKLEADKDSVNVNETVNLKLTHVEVATADTNVLASVSDIILDEEDVNHWKILEGEGTLTQINPAAGLFKAPSTVPSVNPTVVEVSLKNLSIRGKRAKAQLILLAPIHIMNGTYMEGKLDGEPFYIPDVTIYNSLGTIWIQAADITGKSILIRVNGNEAGSYSFGEISETNKAQIVCTLGGIDAYETSYKECPVPPAQTERKYSSGKVALLNYPINGSYMRGTFDATVYNIEDCIITSKKLTGEFRAIKGF